MFIIKYYVLLLYFIYNNYCKALIIRSEIDKLNDEYSKIETSIFEDVKEDDKGLIINMFYDFNHQVLQRFSKTKSFPKYTKDLQDNIDVIEKEYLKVLENIFYFYNGKINRTNEKLAQINDMISKPIDNAEKRMKQLYVSINQNKDQLTFKTANYSWCNEESVSAQQMFFNIYDSIAIIQFKCYLMSRFRSLLNYHVEDKIMPLVKLKRQLNKLFNEVFLNLQKNGAPNFLRGLIITHSEIDRLDEEYRKFEKRMLENMIEKDQHALINIFFEFDRQKIQKVSKYISDRKTFQNSTIEQIQNNIDVIETHYNTFIKYINRTRNRNIAINELKFKIFNVTQQSEKRMKNIYGKINKSGEDWLKILKNISSTEKSISTQLLILNILDTIALEQFKCYFMSRLNIFLHGHYEDNLMPLVKLKREFKKLYNGITLKTHIRTCDPKRFIRNGKEQNYIQFTRLLQGFIPKFDKYPQNCQGTATEYCMEISSTGKVCTSSFPNRNYDYIEYKGGRLGKLQYCKKSSIKQLPKYRAICLCDQQGAPSDRYISLRNVISDVSNNSVITGVKFIKLNRVLHLQAQEGKLLSEGYIDQDTVRWIPIETFNITDREVLANEDYFLLTNKSRTIVMGEVQAEKHEKHYVMTGVGFKYINDKIQLEIQLTKFNWETGTLNITENKLLRNTETLRLSFTPLNADIPTYTNKPSQLWISNPAAISFVNTDFRKDAAQTTVPFLDAQEVVSKPAMPLIGAGLYYKSSFGYGGFIAPVIKQFDYLKREEIILN